MLFCVCFFWLGGSANSSRSRGVLYPSFVVWCGFWFFFDAGKGEKKRGGIDDELLGTQCEGRG